MAGVVCVRRRSSVGLRFTTGLAIALISSTVWRADLAASATSLRTDGEASIRIGFAAVGAPGNC